MCGMNGLQLDKTDDAHGPDYEIPYETYGCDDGAHRDIVSLGSLVQTPTHAL